MEYQELKEELSHYMTKKNLIEIDKYYDVALKIYKDMLRLTNEDYINHPIRVAKILAELKMDTTTIGCALIHEGITLNKITYEEVEEQFGETSAKILEQISKLSHLKRTFKKSNDTDRYRRIVVGLSENPISLFIKLADRLDNLRTIEVHDKEHILDVIDETEKVFIPIAHRLGIKKIKSELEDLCLRNSDKEGYLEVLNKINKDKTELENLLYKMRDELITLLNAHNIKFDITYRVKSVRGIYNKLKAGKKWNQIYDLLGLRILVDKTEECYLIIGLSHSKYRPIPKRFKDYIANPKGNMYQSLHTTIFGVDGTVFEIQIRTHEMDEIAEHGVASHWSYKEKTDGSKTSELENKLAAFRTLIEVNDKEDNKDFFKNLNRNLSKDEIYIFTPKGDIIELPVDATPVDFAYKIHSEIGNTLVGALVNGKLVSLNYTLQDGDIVDLKTQKGKNPSKSWLKFVKTDGAKSRIKSYFNKKEKDKSIETGKEILLEEIKKRKLNEKDLLKEETINECLRTLKADNFEDLCIGITTLKYTPNIIINKLIDITEPKKDTLVEKLLENKNIIENKENGKIIIAGFTDILTTICPKCSPVPGDDIVGYITKGNGVLIHRKDCKNVDLTNKRIINASWNIDTIDKFITSIKINLDQTNDHLIDILTLATKQDIGIKSINHKGNNKNNDIYEIICKVKNKETLKKFMTELSNLKFINSVER